MIVANTFGSFAMLVVMALGGFILSRGQLKSSLSSYICHNFTLLVHSSLSLLQIAFPIGGFGVIGFPL